MKVLLLIILPISTLYTHAFSYVDFADGNYHSISYLVDTNVFLNLQSYRAGTTVELKEGGYLRYSLQSKYDGQVIVSGGSIRYSLQLCDSSTLIMSAGEVGDITAVHNNTLSISGGTVRSNLFVRGNSQAQIANCSIGQDLHVNLNARAVIDNCAIGELVRASGNGRISLSNSLVNTSVIGRHSSEVTLNSGIVKGDLIVLEKSKAVISGGIIENSIRAGTHIDGTYDESTVTIIGTDFFINGVPVMYGEYFASDFSSGHINGILQNGDILNTQFQIWDEASIILTPVPEPSTLILLGLGGLALLRRRADCKKRNSGVGRI